MKNLTEEKCTRSEKQYTQTPWRIDTLFPNKAVNSPEALIGAVRGLLEMVTDSRLHGREIDSAVKAIAQAEGVQP